MLDKEVDYIRDQREYFGKLLNVDDDIAVISFMSQGDLFVSCTCISEL